jgi:DnaJ-class molecular chaperone
MNFKTACEIMEICAPFTKEELKKKYYYLALKYHPDKNPEIQIELFQNMREAYLFLDNLQESTASGAYNLNTKLSATMYDIILNKFIDSITNALDNMNYDTFMQLYEIMQHNGIEEHLPNDLKRTINARFNYIKTQTDLTETIILEPALNDLFDHNIFKYVTNETNQEYYAPMWHHELYFNISENKKLKIICKPKLPECFYIDDDNNLHINAHKQINDIINLKKIKIHLYDDINIFINTETLFIRKYQIKILKNKGFSIINTNDFYNINIKAHIIIHLHLS